MNKCNSRLHYTCIVDSKIVHLGWATSGPPAPVAATGGPPVAQPPHWWRAIWVTTVTLRAQQQEFLKLQTTIKAAV